MPIATRSVTGPSLKIEVLSLRRGDIHHPAPPSGMDPRRVYLKEPIDDLPSGQDLGFRTLTKIPLTLRPLCTAQGQNPLKLPDQPTKHLRHASRTTNHSPLTTLQTKNRMENPNPHLFEVNGRPIEAPTQYRGARPNTIRRLL